MDADLSRRITPQEFAAAADRRFSLLRPRRARVSDAGDAGPKTPIQARFEGGVVPKRRSLNRPNARASGNSPPGSRAHNCSKAEQAHRPAAACRQANSINPSSGSSSAQAGSPMLSGRPARAASPTSQARSNCIAPIPSSPQRRWSATSTVRDAGHVTTSRRSDHSSSASSSGSSVQLPVRNGGASGKSMNIGGVLGRGGSAIMRC